MSWKTKFMVCLLALLVAFGAGAGIGYHYAKTHPEVRTVFTPYEDGLAAYLAELDKAQHSVHVAAYSFTEMRIAEKLAELSRDRKVKVRVLMDMEQTRGWSAKPERRVIDTLRAAGVEVVIGTSEKSKEIMHNKFTVIDGRIVQDGSWNYTRAANRQANILNFVDDYDRAQRFLRYWERMHNFMKTQPQDLPDIGADKDDDEEKDRAKEKKQQPVRRPSRRREG
jgi:phosphatidylserine/phosphatidylglycerophosphate/cardiolipin synthase-like enzyme